MAKILFIAAHRPDRSPSQRYRFEQYFNFLQENELKNNKLSVLSIAGLNKNENIELLKVANT